MLRTYADSVFSEGYRSGMGGNPMALGLVFYDEEEAKVWWAENSHLTEIIN